MAIFVTRDWDGDLRRLAEDDLNVSLLSLLPLVQRKRQQQQQQQQHQRSGQVSTRHEPVEKSDDLTFSMDVQHFAPEEISVKIVDDHLVIEAEHTDRPDEHGFVSRQFKRRCPIPDGYDRENIVSKLSSDGILTVRAPKVKKQEAKERVIPIIHTGPHRAVKQEEEPKNPKNKL